MLVKTSPSLLRQEWLHDAEVALRKVFHANGYKVPANIRTSMGFPKGTKDGKKILGQCWALKASTDEHNEIFISPELGHAGKPSVEASIEILNTMAHEMAHSVCGNKAGHRVIADPDNEPDVDKTSKTYEKRKEKWRMSFPAVAGSVGLVAPWTETPTTPEFAKWSKGIIEKIGKFPAGALVSGARKKDTNRQLKCECGKCGYIVRTTKKWIKTAGPPICPTDKKKMTCDEVDDDE